MRKNHLLSVLFPAMMLVAMLASCNKRVHGDVDYSENIEKYTLETHYLVFFVEKILVLRQFGW